MRIITCLTLAIFISFQCIHASKKFPIDDPIDYYPKHQDEVPSDYCFNGEISESLIDNPIDYYPKYEDEVPFEYYFSDQDCVVQYKAVKSVRFAVSTYINNNKKKPNKQYHFSTKKHTQSPYYNKKTVNIKNKTSRKF